ncbi:MAG TPA: enolase C-terminal domain-like protein [Actinopolymorphaceae bacterium]|jgi:mannonate dehydratase
MTTITRVRVIRTRANLGWTIVKIETNDPGLYGIGSASDLYSPGGVTAVLEELYAPQLIGRDPADIEDIWQTLYASGYWRNGAASNTALGGIDVALWDIKGKQAGMPVYQLLGGRARNAVPCYAHAGGATIDELIEDVAGYVAEGWPVIRAQLGSYGGGGFVPRPDQAERYGSDRSPVFDDEAYLKAIPDMFAALRDHFGFDVKFNHDVHEHLHPINAVRLASLLDPYRLFFLEDVLPPERINWYRTLRQRSSTPQAIGELFVSPHEWRPLIEEELIDFIRTRVSKVGGISGARRIATLADAHGVRTAWQEGGDNDPVNLAAAFHLDMSTWNFGIQEENGFTDDEHEAFPGAPFVDRGYLHPTDTPGLGVDIDEAKAAKLPSKADESYHRSYPIDRRADGTAVRP